MVAGTGAPPARVTQMPDDPVPVWAGALPFDDQATKHSAANEAPPRNRSRLIPHLLISDVITQPMQSCITFGRSIQIAAGLTSPSNSVRRVWIQVYPGSGTDILRLYNIVAACCKIKRPPPDFPLSVWLPAYACNNQ